MLALAVGAVKTAQADEPITLKSKIKNLRCLAMTSDGKTVALGGDSTSVELWDATTGRQCGLLKDHPGQVWSVAFAPDGKTLAVGSYRQTLLWNVATGEELATLKGHKQHVSGLLFTPDGKRLVTVSSKEDTLKVWEVGTGKELAADRGWIHFCVLSPDGTILCKLLQGRFVAWHLATWNKIGTNSGLGYRSYFASISRDNRTLAVDSGDDVILWDLTSGKQTGGHSLHTGKVTSLAFSPDGKTLATGSRDKSALLYDVASKKERATLKGQPGDVVVLFSRDGTTLFTFTPGDRMVKLWDVATGKALGSFQAHKAGIEALDLSADGKTLAVRGKTIRGEGAIVMLHDLSKIMVAAR
jgi:WD40 repeat protein